MKPERNAASVILGSGLTGILTDSAHSQNAETGGFIGFRPMPNTHDSARFGGERGFTGVSIELFVTYRINGGRCDRRL